MISRDTQLNVEHALMRGDMASAGMIAEAALARGEVHAMLYSLAAFRRQQGGDIHGAADLHAIAANLAPNDPMILTAAGDAMRYTSQLREAVALFDRALARDPMMIAAWYGRALALDASGAIEDAKRSYARVAELAPATAPGFAGLASMQALLGELPEARANAQRAHDLAPDDRMAALALARCDMAGGAYENAVGRLQDLIRQPASAADDGVLALGLLGDALDRLGKADEAFDAYSRANARFAEVHAGPNAPPIARERLESIDRAVEDLSPGALVGAAPPVPGEAGKHIFLLGYPRSGTTLVEQILATTGKVETLEEAPTFAGAESQYLWDKGIAALATISDEEAARLRADYWQRVAALGANVAGRTFVDMDPFKGIALPLIARLFPNAKVIFVLRDPRDVVWSCFRRNFVYNPVTYEFTSLERTARHYAAMMRLMQRCGKTLPLNYDVVHYENLVRDFDETTQRLCSFAGLSWSPELRNFGATARSRSVKTASASQVRGGLFDGTGQWQKYRRQLASVFPILEPWIRQPSFEKVAPSIVRCVNE